MASNNASLLLALLATLLLISALVAARDLAQPTKTAESTELEGAKYGGFPGGGGGYPGGGGGYPGRDDRGYHGGGGYNYPGHGGYPGGGCRYGCCGRGYGGCRCCASAAEAAQSKTHT